MASERRRSARVAILGRLHGHAVSLDIPVKVNDLSLAGMAIETPMPFSAGAIQEFELTLGDDTAVVLRGLVVRSDNISPPGVPAVFVTGVEFVDDEPSESDEVGHLMERLD
jgi:hypothetical protein